MTTPVIFELAKLLKEKGFNKPCKMYYHTGGILKRERVGWLNEICEAPTIAEVVMWLYEKHGIWISVNRESESGVFFFSVDKDKGDFFYDKGDDFNSPTEAYEAAIEYTLKNLI